MRRREFITLVGGAGAWPLVARAQQGQSIRRVGVLLAFNETDSRAKGWLSRFGEGLSELGWTMATIYGWTFVGPPMWT
jgi:putative tryptophan/tyrosine transport system substrate-binding protein